MFFLYNLGIESRKNTSGERMDQEAELLFALCIVFSPMFFVAACISVYEMLSLVRDIWHDLTWTSATSAALAKEPYTGYAWL